MPVTATLGSPQYEIESIAVAANLSENVASLHATDFAVHKVSGDDIYDLTAFLEGSRADYTFYIVIPKNRRGSLRVRLNGNAIKQVDSIDDTVTSDEIVIPYDTREPVIVDRTYSGEISPGIWDIYIEFNVPVTGLNTDDFEQDGAVLSAPKIYQSQNNLPASKDTDTPPNSIVDLPDTVGDWTAVPTTGNTVPAKYFLLRFVNPDPLPASMQGDYNLLLKPNAVQGPTGAGESTPIVLREGDDRPREIIGGEAFSETWVFYGTGLTGRTVTGLPNGVTATWSPASLADATVAIHTLTIAGTTNAAFVATAELAAGGITDTTTLTFTLQQQQQQQQRGRRGVIGQQQARLAIGNPTSDPTRIPLNQEWTTYFPISSSGAAPYEAIAKGLLKEEFAYDYQPTRRRIAITGTAKSIGSGTWFIEVKEHQNSEPVIKEVAWKVINQPVAITPIPNLRLYRGVPINFNVPISNEPTSVSAEGLQLGLKSKSVEDGINVDGELPIDANFGRTADDFIIRAVGNYPQTYIENGETLQGIRGIQRYDVLAGSPPPMNPVSAEHNADGDVAYSWDRVPGALSYAYRLEKTGDWVDIGNTPAVTLSDREVFFRVNSPWIGDSLLAGVRIYRGNGSFARVGTCRSIWIDFRRSLGLGVGW